MFAYAAGSALLGISAMLTVSGMWWLASAIRGRMGRGTADDRKDHKKTGK